MRPDQPFSLSLVTGPAAEAIEQQTIQEHCRISGTADNANLYTLWAKAARGMIEAQTSRRFITQTWRMDLEQWPCDGRIELPLQPVSSVSSVKYLDLGGTLQTMVADTDYLTALSRRGPLVYTPPNVVWPATMWGRLDAVRVEFVVGYGSSPADVPEMVKAGIMMACDWWNAFRTGGDDDPTKAGISPGVLRMIRLLDDGGYR